MKISTRGMFAVVLFLVVILTGTTFAAVSNCCEKTTSGALCVDADISECATGFLAEPTACISTSYCALGTCVNKQEGDCTENTPQQSCNSELGFWSESSPADIPQCQLGCCFIGDQAAFVTNTRCKGLASLYGLETSFQKNIQNEILCIASASADVKGACVFEQEFETTCKMLTKKECTDLTGQDRNTEFHEGFLCTADELATNCASTKKTTCVEGRDEVFFLDSCGNLANVYDSTKIENKPYWTEIMEPTCGSGNNAGSDKCGECNYYDGSTCKTYDRKEDTVKPTYGDNICRSLDCTFDNNGNGTKENYLHGESWCANSDGTGLINVTGGEIQDTSVNNSKVNLPGSRYFRMVCYNGEVTVEPCADMRAEICMQSERKIENRIVNIFRSSTCRVNEWQTCAGFEEKELCEDFALKDCQWIEDTSKCAPLFAPGLEFWSEDTVSSEDVCKISSTTCEARYEKKGGFLGGLQGIVGAVWKQLSGEECFRNDEGKNYKTGWGNNQNNVCSSLGDCQGTVTIREEDVSYNKTITKTKNYLGLN